MSRDVPDITILRIVFTYAECPQGFVDRPKLTSSNLLFQPKQRVCVTLLSILLLIGNSLQLVFRNLVNPQSSQLCLEVLLSASRHEDRGGVVSVVRLVSGCEDALVHFPSENRVCV